MRPLLVIGVALALVPATASAQRVSAGASMQTYRISEASGVPAESGTLLTLPIHARATVLDGIDASVETAFARAAFGLSGRSGTVASGIVDTRVTVETRRAGFGIRLVGILPTGEVVGSLEEAMVVGRLSSELLPFAVRQWGTGGGWGGDLGYRLALRAAFVDASVGLVALRGSRPTGVAYAPARQLRARVHVQSALGRTSMWSLIVGAQKHSADEAEGTPFYRAGLRLEGVLSAGFPVGARESGIVYAGVFAHGTGDLLSGLRQEVLVAGANDGMSRQVFAGGVELRARRNRLTLLPRVDVRAVRSTTGLGQGWLGSIGGRAELHVSGDRMGRRTVLEPSAMLRWGALAPEGDSSSTLFGLDLGVAVHWDGGR